MALAAFIEMIYICIHQGTISLQLNKQRTFFIYIQYRDALHTKLQNWYIYVFYKIKDYVTL